MLDKQISKLWSAYSRDDGKPARCNFVDCTCFCYIYLRSAMKWTWCFSHCLRLVPRGRHSCPKSGTAREVMPSGTSRCWCIVLHRPKPGHQALRKASAKEEPVGIWQGQNEYIMVYREIMGYRTLMNITEPTILNCWFAQKSWPWEDWGMPYFQTKPFEKWRGVGMA